MKRVLLTGASGFVGSHVLRHILVNTDWYVVCPTTFTHKGLQDRIRHAVREVDEDYARTKVIRCDFTSPISPLTAYEFGDIDYVLNIASESHVDRSIDYPAPFIINNVSLICHVLDWAREVGVEKFVQISTDEVYGPAPDGYAHKEWRDQHLPSNPYSASKAAQEDISFAYWRTYGLPIAITNCWDMETRVMTENGMKGYTELSEGDKVWTLDADENMVLESVKKKIKMSSSGKMIKFDGSGTDQLVTPNHRMMFRKSVGSPRRWGGIEEAHAADLIGMKGRIRVPRFGNWHGNSSDTVETPFGEVSAEWAAEICGWFVSEGWVNKTIICLGAGTEDQKLEMERLLGGYGRVYRNGRTVAVANKELGNWLVSMCGSGSYDKRLSSEIKGMDSKYLEVFLNAAVDGDGTRYGAGGVIYTVSEDLAYDYAEIAMKVGYAAKVSSRVTKSFRTQEPLTSYIMRYSTNKGEVESRNISEVGYDGDVWCISVPSGRVFIERGGNISLTGQTMNIIGEMQDPEKFVPMVIKNILNDETVTIHGSVDGPIGSRFYLHARNQADGLLHVLNQPFLSYKDGNLMPLKFHIAGEREVDNLELAKIIAYYVGKPLKYEIIDFHTSRPGHDLRYALDCSDIEATGWKAPLPLEESLEKTVRWTLDNREWLIL